MGAQLPLKYVKKFLAECLEIEAKFSIRIIKNDDETVTIEWECPANECKLEMAGLSAGFSEGK